MDVVGIMFVIISATRGSGLQSMTKIYSSVVIESLNIESGVTWNCGVLRLESMGV